MKKLLIVLTLLVSGVYSFAQEKTVEIKTSAICEMCQYAIEKQMAFEKGVKSANLNLENKVLMVAYNPKKTDPETIRRRVSLTGYHADDVKRDSLAYEKLPLCCKDGAHEDEHEEPHQH